MRKLYIWTSSPYPYLCENFPEKDLSKWECFSQSDNSGTKRTEKQMFHYLMENYAIICELNTWRAIKYSTDNPKTILQTAGCGRVKGPLGKARTDITKNIKMTHLTPAQTFSLKSSSFLHKRLYINITYNNWWKWKRLYLVKAEYNSAEETIVSKVIVWGL